MVKHFCAGAGAGVGIVSWEMASRRGEGFLGLFSWTGCWGALAGVGVGVGGGGVLFSSFWAMSTSFERPSLSMGCAGAVGSLPFIVAAAHCQFPGWRMSGEHILMTLSSSSSSSRMSMMGRPSSLTRSGPATTSSEASLVSPFSSCFSTLVTFSCTSLL